MLYNQKRYQELLTELKPYKATLVAVSKTKSVEAIRALREAGQDDFGENYVQELSGKARTLNDDIRWHYIGHLQSNKVKTIVPISHLIHSVHSLKLLKELNKQGEKAGRTVSCLLQAFIASEETKFGMTFDEMDELLHHSEISRLKNISIKGLMGMASNCDDTRKINAEFLSLKNFFEEKKKENMPDTVSFEILSMGMTGDYRIALDQGSTMVRIGSAIFGERKYTS